MDEEAVKKKAWNVINENRELFDSITKEYAVEILVKFAHAICELAIPEFKVDKAEVKEVLNVYEKWKKIEGSDYGKFSKQWERNAEAWQAIKTVAERLK